MYLPLANFSVKRKRKDGSPVLQSRCRSCANEAARILYKTADKTNIIARNKKNAIRQLECIHEYVANYLKNHPCIKCGTNNILVLEFHHLNQSEKRLEVSIMIQQRWSIKTIAKEIDKCVVLCGNCHRRITAKQGNTFKYQQMLQWCAENNILYDVDL